MSFIPSILKRRRCVVFVVLAFVLADSAGAQSLLNRLRWERTKALATEITRHSDGRMKLRPTDPLGVLSDSVRQWIMMMSGERTDSSSDDPGGIRISGWHTVRENEIPVYRPLFDTTKWAFLGSSSLSELDTTLTRELRSRLESRFGRPTRTLVEIGQPSELDRAEMIQFEYWFVLNDSIPVIVIDVNGPWDRGLVMASNHSYRRQLSEIKEAFLGQLVTDEVRKPFADYYYNPEQQVWYVTGFDGASFFDVRIGRPNLGLGRPNLGEYISRSSRSQE